MCKLSNCRITFLLTNQIYRHISGSAMDLHLMFWFLRQIFVFIGHDCCSLLNIYSTTETKITRIFWIFSNPIKNSIILKSPTNFPLIVLIFYNYTACTFFVMLSINAMFFWNTRSPNNVKQTFFIVTNLL